MTVLGWIVISVFSVLALLITTKAIVEFIWNRRLNAFKVSEHISKVKMPVERWVKYGYSLALSAAVIVVSVFSGMFSPVVPLGDKTLVNANRVGNEVTLNHLINDYLRDSGNYNYYPEFGAEDLADVPTAESRDHTDTNVQVEGVDEGDVLKTDGYRVFYAPRYYNVIEVLDIEDDHTMTHVESMVIDDFRVDSLYLTDDYLVVIGYRYEEMIYPMDTLDMYWGFYFYEQTASIIVFDTDTLEEVYRLETDLSFIDHRLIDNTLYIVSTKWFYIDQEPRPEFDETVNGETSKSYLSYMDMYYFDDVPASSMTVITSLDLNTFTQSSQGFIGATSQIYVTENSIYSYYTNYNYTETAEGYDYNIETNIVKYHINQENQTIDYVASTSIEGIVEDRYWLDESGDYLRVVTSRSWWGNDLQNSLYILKENPETDTFDLVSLIDENIGHENEHVESVRFHGDYVNIVTFERTDPLYTFDLSDPENPVMLDNPIEEAGYSEYLHIWDQSNHVLGLGFLDANEDGRIDGMKLSAYDTNTGTILDTDPYPYEDGTGWRYSYTEAMYNPKALMVSVDLGLFGFPMVSYHYDNETYNYTYHTSFVVYQIDFSQNNVLGEPIIIEHESTDWYNQVDRGVYIDGYIYTFSAHEILSYNLSTELSFEQLFINYEQ